MKEVQGTVTFPQGFSAVGAHVGIKKVKKDLALIQSEVPANAAGCFTTNIVKAAPVLWDRDIIDNRYKVLGIVVNSGNANACTGAQGKNDTFQMAACYGALLGVEPGNVLVCSTGVIGVPMPMETILGGIQNTYSAMGKTSEDGMSAAEAILTTDTFSKTVAVTFEINGKTVRMGAMAKGSGMINPNMATMLSFITTDLAISADMLNKALLDSNEDTYNMISVDGDTSTNDTVLVLANGLAGNMEIDTENEDYAIFKEALDYVNKKLAIAVVRDGEGATKLMEVKVSGAHSKEDARKIAQSIVSSNLFKAALFGADANWGRVLCAMGYSGGSFNQEKVQIVFRSEKGSIVLMDEGAPVIFDEAIAKEVLSEKEIFIDVLLQDGKEFAVAWGCDLTYDYVRINGDYRS